jgi:hypothetical protein
MPDEFFKSCDKTGPGLTIARLYRPRRKLLDGTWTFPKRSRSGGTGLSLESGEKAAAEPACTRSGLPHVAGLPLTRSRRKCLALQ